MDASGRLDRRGLRLLGFPVTVNNGFWLFLLIVFAIDPGPDGLVLAVALAVFTIIHELGHALVARRLGAEASIALGFMVGYTAYAPRRPLGTAARMALSAAGPVAHIAVGWLCLLPWAQHPLDLDPIAASGAATAIWWAGAVIGAANLIPVWPLDGGHLLSAALQPV
ncbi:MAG: metalloprotease, partial [Ilumatobacteraceae bacterium]